MELDSLPKVIKIQTKPGVPRGMGLRGVPPWSMPLLQVLCVWSRDQKGKLHRSSGISAFPPSFLCPNSKNGLGFFPWAAMVILLSSPAFSWRWSFYSTHQHPAHAGHREVWGVPHR